ncbi:hypothetical protein QTO34_016767 [Cnephaeus nilssonii]|uniref:Uncharacterized protein n=1 Tax=Cnephaeus nilssonii TaxID=3371016 RepID=A0AA40LSG7_CNENI|nr:hypothetical protein QTO34_016767 [Eptesicus nilssonii]
MPPLPGVPGAEAFRALGTSREPAPIAGNHWGSAPVIGYPMNIASSFGKTKDGGGREPGAPVTRQPHSITALPSHSDRDLGEDPMFSCCLPVSRGRCLKRGSDESVFSRGRRWIRTRTQRQGRLWPFSRRRHSESSTRAKERPKLVKEEPQLVHEDPCPTPSREGPVSHTAEGQRRPEVHVAAWGSGEPGPMGAGRRTPPPEPHMPQKTPTSKPLSPNRPMALFNSVLQCCACGNRTRTEDLEPKEAEPKAQGADVAPPVTSKVHAEDLEAELEAELEACAPPEPVPPPAASPAAAVEPGSAPDTTEAPPALEEEPSPGPLLVPASEEELPVEAPTQGPPVECPQPVPRGKLVFPPLLDISVFFIVLILFLCSPWRIFFFGLFLLWAFGPKPQSSLPLRQATGAGASTITLLLQPLPVTTAFKTARQGDLQ